MRIASGAAHVIGVSIGDGWYSQASVNVGQQTLLLQASILFADGTTQVVSSDSSWSVSRSPVTAVDIYKGETCVPWTFFCPANCSSGPVNRPLALHCARAAKVLRWCVSRGGLAAYRVNIQVQRIVGDTRLDHSRVRQQHRHLERSHNHEKPCPRCKSHIPRDPAAHPHRAIVSTHWAFLLPLATALLVQSADLHRHRAPGRVLTV